MSVPWATVLARLKETLIDANLDFWVETRLKEWYDDGAQMQHRMILENATASGKALAFNDPYLKHFLKASVALPFVVGQRDYALPLDYYRLIGAEILDIDDETHQCRTVDIGDDFRIRSLPNWGPIPERPYVALTEDGKARFYLSGGDLTPADAGLRYLFNYYRDVLRTTTLNVDLEDPHNVGPQAFAVAKACEKEGRDPAHFFAQAQAAANVIMPAPAQAAR